MRALESIPKCLTVFIFKEYMKSDPFPSGATNFGAEILTKNLYFWNMMKRGFHSIIRTSENMKNFWVAVLIY